MNNSLLFNPEQINVWLIAKLGYLLGLIIYLAFTVIVIRQVDLMTKALNGELNKTVKLIAWIHLGLALGVFLLAIFVL